MLKPTLLSSYIYFVGDVSENIFLFSRVNKGSYFSGNKLKVISPRNKHYKQYSVLATLQSCQKDQLLPKDYKTINLRSLNGVSVKTDNSLNNHDSLQLATNSNSVSPHFVH